MSDLDDEFRGQHTWVRKFANAGRGCWEGVRGQSSFAVHLFAAVSVVIAGLALRLGRGDWALLALAITLVLTAEMFNSALEFLARAITTTYDPNIRNALDIASGAVLVAALGSVVIGLIVFVPPLWELVFGGRAG